MHVHKSTHLEGLCSRYGVGTPETLVAGFLRFKERFIDKLEFVDAQMLRTYEFAFFCSTLGLRPEMFLKSHRFNRKIFLEAVREVKRACSEDGAEDEEFVCGLYSIVHGVPTDQSPPAPE